jgi:hypothetical protein
VNHPFQIQKQICSIRNYPKRYCTFIGMKYAIPMIPAMTKKILLLLAIAMVACGMASADMLLTVSASGQFSGSDVADSSLVAPNGVFSLSFVLDSNPTPLAGTVTSLSFDAPLLGFTYKLNDIAVNITPSEISFNTLANGGLFDVTFGSGLSSSEFVFEGAQTFSGTTAAPVITMGTYPVSSWIFSDPANYDFGTPGASASIGPVPEPSTIFLLSSSLAVLIIQKFHKR